MISCPHLLTDGTYCGAFHQQLWKTQEIQPKVNEVWLLRLSTLCEKLRKLFKKSSQGLNILTLEKWGKKRVYTFIIYNIKAQVSTAKNKKSLADQQYQYLPWVTHNVLHLPTYVQITLQLYNTVHQLLYTTNDNKKRQYFTTSYQRHLEWLQHSFSKHHTVQRAGKTSTNGAAPLCWEGLIRGSRTPRKPC